MVPVCRYKRFWHSHVVGGKLVIILVLGAMAPIDKQTPVGGNTQAQSQTTAEQRHKGGQVHSHLDQVVPNAVDTTQQQRAAAYDAEEYHGWYADPDWWVAGGTGLLSLFTLGLWIFTALLWNITRKAFSDTEKSIRLAERSVIAAEKASHVERAWLFPSGRVPFGRLENTTVGSNLRREGAFLQVEWRNGGRTPAIRANSTVTFQTIDNDAAPPHFKHELAAESLGVVGQSMLVTTPACFITKEDVDAAKLRKKKLIVYSRIEYYDIFNSSEKRFSEVTWHFDFNGTRTDLSGNSSDNIRMEYVGPQNGCC